MRTFKLGTRRSLLAWAQSSWVAREVERLNPGTRVELVGIDTRGDKILDVSLSKVEGKEFFVAELDNALRSGEVDFTVHSMKDLSLHRPSDFTLAAIPRRENCRDVILFGPRALERLRSNEVLRIGTSSPRRIENIPAFLEKALPRHPNSKAGPAPRFELTEIRGNVNTRLSRVHVAADHPKYLDAVVLAFAGLIRLWADPAGREELTRLFSGVKWMILPLKDCPTAPAQGALAVECRTNDAAVREALAELHHPKTAELVARERAILSEWGGGCHQKFGASAISHQTLGSLLFIRGRKPGQPGESESGDFIEDTQWNEPPAPAGLVNPWNGSERRLQLSGEQLDLSGVFDSDGLRPAVFVAHHRAVASGWAHRLSLARVWTSGTASWFKLAELGIWVEGCAENMGFDFLTEIIREPALRLPALDSAGWDTLTHEQGLESWKDFPQIRPLATYRIDTSETDLAETALPELEKATHVFWSSGSQFDTLASRFPKQAHHACGPGKTARHLRIHGLNPDIFPSVEEWKKWLKNAKK
jgi:hydroxymethylbilane synthase